MKGKSSDLYQGKDNEFRTSPHTRACSKWPIGILAENRNKDEKADGE